MNKDALISAVDDLAAEKEGAEKTVVQLTKQVWQIDWTVAVFDIISHYLAFDIPYFYRFMSMDIGDEAEEKQILNNWINERDSLDKGVKAKLTGLVDELNQIRVSARQG